MNAEEYTMRCVDDIWSALFDPPKKAPEPDAKEPEPVQIPLPFP